jgi:hypothetical protein
LQQGGDGARLHLRHVLEAQRVYGFGGGLAEAQAGERGFAHDARHGAGSALNIVVRPTLRLAAGGNRLACAAGCSGGGGGGGSAISRPLPVLPLLLLVLGGGWRRMQGGRPCRLAALAVSRRRPLLCILLRLALLFLAFALFQVLLLPRLRAGRSF